MGHRHLPEEVRTMIMADYLDGDLKTHEIATKWDCSPSYVRALASRELLTNRRRDSRRRNYQKVYQKKYRAKMRTVTT